MVDRDREPVTKGSTQGKLRAKARERDLVDHELYHSGSRL